MRVVPTPLAGVLVVEPHVHRDARGFFLEVFHAGRLAAEGLAIEVAQHNHSCSRGGTLRGLHLQTVEPQGKLVRCVAGEIFDVAVDVRVGSPAFGRWHAERLSAADFRQLWIPPGFAHGFAALADEVQVEYLCTAPYHAEGELAVRWDDPEIGIEWPLADPLLSAKDAAAPRLAELADRLPRYRP